MKTLKLFWRDMRIGTFRHWQRFLIAPITVFIMAGGMYELIRPMEDAGYTENLGTCMDYYLYMMQGMYVYKFSPQSDFVIPISWFMLHIGIAYITAYYPHKDFEEYGSSVLMSAKSRSSWWVAKLLWCAMNVCLYYLLILLSSVAVGLRNGAEFSFLFSTDIMARQYGDAVRYLSQGDILLIAFVLPFAISVMLCEVQILLGFLTSPVAGFAITGGLLVVSAYYTGWYFAGNYLMWVRSSYVNYEGVRSDGGILIALYGLIVAAAAGKAYIKNWDIL